MNLDQLTDIAEKMVAPGKGILAADESSGTIKKRFDAINVESTEETRRDYRELLFRTESAMKENISGVILYDETIRQKAADGTAPGQADRGGGLDPGNQGRCRRQAAPGLPGRDRDGRARRAARAPEGVLRAWCALRQMARGDRHCRRHPDLDERQDQTPMRWRAMRRSARRRISSRSSSRKC